MQRNVLEYLDASARRVPDKIAFADDQTSVTFGALSRQAQGLGTWLARHTGAVNVPVAVFIDRTAQSITAMQGVLYAGCCYVPIDNKMPELRIRSILKQVRPRALVYAAADEALARTLADCCPLCPLRRRAPPSRTRRCWSAAAAGCWTWTRCIFSSPPAPPARPRAL